MEVLSDEPVDFILLCGDTLPDIFGLALLRDIRQISQVPLIYYTGKDSPSQKIRILEAGADDYLCKPLDLDELTARIGAVWRRYQIIPSRKDAKPTGRIVSYPQLSVNLDNYSVVYNGHPLEMPPKELELLYFLASSPNQVFTREQLLNQIWGYDYMGDPRTVDVHIKRIREKIKDHSAWSLDTVWAVGYKFSLHSNYTLSDGPSAPSV